MTNLPAGPDYPGDRMIESSGHDPLPLAVLEEWSDRLRIWATAADTLALEPSELAARRAAAEAPVTVLHRWPTGPWLMDDGDVWECDDQLSRLNGALWQAQTDRAVLEARVGGLRAALEAVKSSRRPALVAAAALDADDQAARPLSEVLDDLLDLPGRCSPGSPFTHCGRTDCTSYGCGEAL